VLFLAMGLFFFFDESAEQRIQIVREGFLDLRPGTPIGETFEGYRWWQRTSWDLKGKDGDDQLIDFTGYFRASQAAEEFKKNHQYEFRMSLKYTRWKPFFEIGEFDEEDLAIVIGFLLHKDGSFSVHSGRVGLKHPKQGTWRYVPLADKAVVAMIKGFYHQIDPYTALVNGLPYK